MNLKFQSAYVSCGCNKVPHVADWGLNGLICFGSCNSVVIYEPEGNGDGGKIIHTLFGHKDRVNCVRWLKNNFQIHDDRFVSASADGTAILWAWCNNKKTYIQDAILKGHSSIVNIVDGFVKIPSSFHNKNDHTAFIATSSVDSTVMIWEKTHSEQINCIDTLNWGSGFCLDIKLSMFPETDIMLLACAADDSNVHIFFELQKSEIDHLNQGHRFCKTHIITGHEDWVRSIDIVINNLDLYLATGSQDTYIRLYKFEKVGKSKMNVLRHSSNSTDVIEHDKKVIKVGSKFNECYFAVLLETILAGHEGWVYGVSWHPASQKQTNEISMDQTKETIELLECKQLKLLSASMDKSMIIWSPDKSGIWSEETRVGEVGGNMLGFYGGKFGLNGRYILGHGYQGSFHMWCLDKDNKSWKPKVVVSGHTSEVTDLAWDPHGNYVVSVGSDQTTRLHAPWVRKERTIISWHEIARPQIHGFDLSCLAMLSQHKFASGAEEKVIRAFIAPNNFVENFKRICDIKDESNDQNAEKLPLGASVPALGLSNKPVFQQMKKEGFLIDDEYPDLYFSPICLTEPPTEENLMQNTLWPEVQKLYGHGYEIYCLAARHDGVVLASSCKATSPEHAVIILWNAKTWLQIQKLMAHQLTVTQMSFSPNGKYLLSVSRDRKWCLFGVKKDGKTYELIATSDVKNSFHTRVIWCCTWTSDSLNFATGSRDGKVGIWSFTESFEEETRKATVHCLIHLELSKESVTALAFAPVMWDQSYILAVGLERGQIKMYQVLDKIIKPLNVSFEGNLGHDLTVKRLVFRPKAGRTGSDNRDTCEIEHVLQLASCGSDHIIKIYELIWNT